MSRRPVHTRRTVALLAVGALALSACGSDEEPAADVPEVDSSTPRCRTAHAAPSARSVSE